MALHLGSSRLSRLPPAGVEAAGARRPTSASRGTPRERCAGATASSRSARPARFGAVAVALLAVAGCKPYVEGNCVNGSETRALTGTFQGVRVETGLRTTINAGAAQPKLVVSGDANLLDYIQVELGPDQGSVPATVLRLWIEVPDGNYTVCIPPTAVLDAGELSFVGAYDDAHVDSTGVAADALNVEARGKSDVTVAGAGGARLDVVADDAYVHAGSYPVATATQVTLSSGARVEVSSDGPVTGTVASGCTLYNYGAGTCAGVVGSGSPPPIVCPGR